MSIGNETPAGPVQGALGPDAQPQSVADIGRQFVNAIFKDGGVDPMEQKIIYAVFAEIQTRIQAQQAQMQQQPGGGTPEQMSPTPPSQNETDFDETPGAASPSSGGFQ